MFHSISNYATPPLPYSSTLRGVVEYPRAGKIFVARNLKREREKFVGRFS